MFSFPHKNVLVYNNNNNNDNDNDNDNNNNNNNNNNSKLSFHNDRISKTFSKLVLRNVIHVHFCP